MKFDRARAKTIFEELGDSRFSGPDGETRVADFVVTQFEAVGCKVERREVLGSPWPGRLAIWVWWLGVGGGITAVSVAFALVQTAPFSVLAALAAFIFASGSWLHGVNSHRIRLGSRREPLGSAPLVIASSDGDPSAPVRVVFQVILGNLATDSLRTSRAHRLLMFSLVGGLCFFGALSATAKTGAPRYFPFFLAVATAFLALAWVAILWILSFEYRTFRSTEAMNQPDRPGLAVLMEMVRNWPRGGPKRIEALFVAAGGQRLDYAGSREVLRLLESRWSSKPTLLLLFVAPGAGDKLLLCASEIASSGTEELALDAARSLWIPFRRLDYRDLSPHWPFEQLKPTIALVGSDPSAFCDNSVDPQALHRAAQLATEIAIRWAKKQSGSRT